MVSGPNRLALPRVLVSAPSSSTGKTTVALGIMAALVRRGLSVAPFKTGPDYIDPGFHTLAAGRVGRNLDPHLCREELVQPLLAHGFLTPTAADLAVIEGAMGLFDGQLGVPAVGAGRAGFGSSAHVAALVQAPVVLVVDAHNSSRTVAAVVHGLASFDPDVRVAGVVLNRTSSPRNIAEVSRALDDLGIAVLGALPTVKDLATPSRHLGLVPAAERDEAGGVVEAAAALVEQHLDLDALVAIARSAPELDVEPWSPGAAVRPTAEPVESPVIAVAGGRAFTFRYPENVELLEAAGCRCVDFDPLVDAHLPAGTAGLLIGGGFPEVYASELAGNTALMDEVRAAIASGMPTVAECAGLLYLCRTLDGTPMVGALPLDAAMGPRLTLGYHEVRSLTDTLLTRPDEVLRAHEFHRTQVQPAADQAAEPVEASAAELVEAWEVVPRPGVAARTEGWSADPAGTGRPTVHASYQHTHWAGFPLAAARFAAAVREFAESAKPHPTAELVEDSGPSSSPGTIDLRHHGDKDLRPGTVDLAVNVRDTRPPQWLMDELTRRASEWAAYPDATEARQAIAALHGVPDEMVLPTAGAAEAFTLVARALPWTHPVVVHPQFTEPEQALVSAGHRVARHVLTSPFVLDASSVDATADLVVVGNPTNPTGVLHPAEVLHRLRGPGRVLLVDEAFMDAIPGEPESLVGTDMTGLLVTRSLTKTWSLAGIRAGYVVGDPELVARLAELQTPWSVSTPALHAMVACATDHARAESSRIATEVTTQRDALDAELRAAGFDPVPGRAPFVLVNTQIPVLEQMRSRGFALRRGDTFPGLGADWVRLAVRDADTSRRAASALREILDRKDPS